MDNLSESRRSWNMSQIHARDTQPERAVRSALFESGLRYRVNVRGLPGTPDIVLRKYSAVVFVHGCFWHRHPGCHLAYSPKTNTESWRAKFAHNVSRDALVSEQLKSLGWRVFTIWECQVSNPRKLRELIQAVTEAGLSS
jgi:DNA mismatch endonuclease (patch repair protein)